MSNPPVSLLGYHVSFDDEMTTPASMRNYSNAYPNGNRTLYTNNEDQKYLDYDANDPNSPFSFANGALSITARPMATDGLSYTSGLLSTANTFSQNQGYFEIRMMTPYAQGFWPAFWMMTKASFPEIDINEQPNNSGSRNEYWAHISTSDDSSGGFQNPGVDVTQGYHSYGFYWDANTVQFTFDGLLQGYPHPTPASLTGQQLFLLANLAVGNPASWPGAPASGASYTTRIDYIRAYSNDPNVKAVALQPISSPDGVDTTPSLAVQASVTPAINIGSGPDQFVVMLSEDAYAGDAQFTVALDDHQQGGTLTTTALHGAGQSQKIAINGYFGTDPHRLTVTFLNDAYGGANQDRNLYVDSASFNGSALSPASGALYSNGSLTFLRPGTSSDTLTLAMAEDAYQGDARAEISIDGKVLGTATVTAANAGAPQLVSFTGDFGGVAPHSVGVNFLNDASGPGGDRNLYVKGISFDGVAHPGANAGLWWSGQANFAI